MREQVVARAQRVATQILTALAAAFSLRDVEGMVQNRDTRELEAESGRAYDRLAELVLALYLDSLRDSARAHPKLVPDTSRWRVLREQAEIRSDLSTRLSDDQKRIISDIISSGRGDSTRQVALRVHLALGLTLPQVTALRQYEDVLLYPNPRRPQEIVPLDLLQTALTATAREYRSQRATFLGLAEAQRAWGRAEQEVWTQAAESRLVEVSDIVRVWRVTFQNTRDSHLPMDLQERGLHQAFRSGDGHPLLFPGDHGAPIKEWAGCNCYLLYENRNKLALREQVGYAS